MVGIVGFVTASRWSGNFPTAGFGCCLCRNTAFFPFLFFEYIYTQINASAYRKGEK